jgi:hypothetical protein
MICKVNDEIKHLRIYLFLNNAAMEKGYVVQLPTHAKYAQILKNSVAFKEAANERLFLMKDLAAVEEAVGLGAKIYEGASPF